MTHSDEWLARPLACQGQSAHCIVSTGLGRTGAQESGCLEPGGSCACPMAELSSVFLRPCFLIGEIVTERHAHCLHIASLSSLFCKPQGEATASKCREGNKDKLALAKPCVQTLPVFGGVVALQLA